MGVRNGTDTPTFYVIPQEMWSDDLKKIARRLKMTTDCDVTFIAGNMQVSQDGRNFRIRGYYDQANKQIVVQADHGSYSAEQIAKHEEFHARQSRDPGLLREIVERIDRRYGPDELRRVIAKYDKLLHGIDPADTNGETDMYERAQRITEEILADAHAEMNAFGAGKYWYETVTTIHDWNMRKGSQTANGTRETRGPPAQRYSVDEHGNVVVDDDVTPGEVRATLETIQNRGRKQTGFTFPVLKHTPQVYIDYCGSEDRSFVMHAKKAYNAMQTNTGAQHALGVDGMMEVFEKIARPDYIIFQNEGRNAGHYVSIVTIQNGEVVAAIDLGNFRGGVNAVNDEAGFYNVVVTAFPAESDYINGLFENVNNDVIYDRNVDKKYEDSETVALGESPTGRSTDSSDNSIISGANNTVKDQQESKQKFSAEDLKERQLRVIQDNNAAQDDQHTWIRSTDDIRTFAEAIHDSDYEGTDIAPDYTWEMAQQAEESGEITIYSSNAIRPGTFVTPSKMEAQNYGPNVRSMTVPVEQVAWIDAVEGQYTGDVSRKLYSVDVDEDQVTFDDITGGEMERSSWDPVFREKYETAAEVTADVKEYFAKLDENDPNWLSGEDIDGMLNYDPFAPGWPDATMDEPGYVAELLLDRAMDQTGAERQESYLLAERLLPYMDALTRQTYTGDGAEMDVFSPAFKRWYDKRHPSIYYPGYEPGDLFDRGKADSWKAWDNQDREAEYLRNLLDSGKLMEPELTEARQLLDRLENPKERETFYSLDEEELREEYDSLGEELEELKEFFGNLEENNGVYSLDGRTFTVDEIRERAARLEEAENRHRELEEIFGDETAEEDSEAAAEEDTEEELPFEVEEDEFYEERRSSGELGLGETEREETRAAARQTEAERDAGERGQQEGLRIGALEETEETEAGEEQTELPEDPKDRTIRELEAANRDLQRYAENWRKQASITGEGEETAKRSDVRRFTKELAEEADYQGDRAELQQKVQALSDMVVSNDKGNGLDWNEIRRQAREIAEDLVDNSYTVLDPEADTRKAILADLKQLKIRPDQMWTRDFGDWDSFRRQHIGTLVFSAKEGRNIDDVYRQLQASYGEGLFPENITAGSDQVLRILDALDQLRPTQNYNFANDQDAEMATDYYQNRITDEVLFGNIGEELTKADRNYRRVKERMRKAEQQLRDVKKESRQKIEDLQRMQRHEVRAAMDRQRQNTREREEKQKLRKKISQTGKRLVKYLTENNGAKNPIPEPLKEAVGKVLLDLDISGGMDVKQKKKYVQDMQQVARIVTQQNAYMDGRTEDWAGLYLDLPADIQAELDEHLQNVQRAMNDAEARGKVWNPNMMNTEELQRLDEILTVLTSAITNSNEILSDARGAKISEEASEGIKEIDSLGTDRNRSERGESVNRFLRFQNTTPYYFFKRLGSAGMRMFERIQNGWDQFAFNARQVVDFANETYTEQEAKEIQETVFEFNLRRRGDMSEGFDKTEKVTMTKAQIMSLYCLWKREQAQGHLTGAGIRIADYRQGKNTVTQAENYLLDLEDIAQITGKLTKRDREIADALQKYMNTQGSEWGNEVSMKRFGIRSFTEENYFPITTDDRTRPVRNPESDTANLYRLLNMSFTKATQRGASNSVVIDNIFDVFANHMADMAKYNGLGLPMLDAMKWMSYSQTSELSEDGQYGYESVQKSMERAFGKEARNYFTTFMKDLNGVREGGRGEEFGSRMMSSYKVAAVGANLRVALLQPTSYIRAMAVLDKKYLVKGLGLSNKQGQEEARTWSGTAVWKDLGFYDTNINAGLREMIKHTDGLKGKIQEVSMKGAEIGDKTTWGALWNACKAEQTDKGFTGDELMKKTAERFREVVYRTQVMDSTMTRSHVMRQKGAYAGMVTAFMSEPTLSYNMLLDAYTEYENEVRKETQGATDKATVKKARAKAWEKAGPAVGRAAAAYVATATLSAIVESAIDAARDDDEYANFLERFAEKMLGFNVKDPDSTTWEKIKGITSGNLVQDLLIHNKLPVVKDFFGILSGNSTSRMDTEWMGNIIRAGQIAWESLALRMGWIDEPTKITYKGNMTTWGKLYNILRGVSQVTGLPLGNAMRDLTAMYNSTVGEITGQKIQTYDPGPEKQIQYALKDGYLTEDDAVKLLLQKELAEDETEARQKAYEWANPQKYENMLAAMRAGDKAGFDAAKEQLEDLRYKRSGIMHAVTADVKEMYLGTDGTEPISRDEAMSLLMDYGGMIERKAETEIQKWTCELETGIPYDGIDEAYVAGDITREAAEKMLVDYGGYAEDKAASQVQKWTSQVDEGIWYSEIDDYYYYGDITQKEAVDMYMEYGGMDRETAENTVLETKFLKDFGRERDRLELQDMYVSGEYDRETMKDIMLEYGYSKTEDSAENSLIRWDFIGDDMTLDGVTPNQAKAWFNGLEDTGIDKHTYLDFADRVADVKGDKDENGASIMYSKMDKVLALIDSLDLSAEQKDALALLYGADGKGYAEKNLSRAPWHDGDKDGKSTKKKSGGKRGGGRRGGGGGRRGGGRRGGGGGGGLSLPEVEVVDSGHSYDYDDILDKWRKGKLTRAQLLKLLKEGKLTQKEVDEILGTTQDGADSDLLSSGLKLGAAEDADLLREP